MEQKENENSKKADWASTTAIRSLTTFYSQIFSCFWGGGGKQKEQMQKFIRKPVTLRAKRFKVFFFFESKNIIYRHDKNVANF